MSPIQLSHSFVCHRRKSCIFFSIAIIILIVCVQFSNIDNDRFEFSNSQMDEVSINQTNEELVNQTTVTPKSNTAVNKIAFLFLIRSTLPLAPLWVKFFRNYDAFFSIYINSKPKYPLKLPEPFRSANHFSHDTKWGGFGMLEAEILLLSSALLDKSNKRFILLSDSCIPLFKFEYVYHYLMDTQDNFIHIVTQTHKVNIERYSDVFLPEIPRSAWSKGSQWFELTDHMARLVTTDKVYYPKFKKFCSLKKKPSCIPDEHYLPTTVRQISRQFPRHYLAKRSLTWVNWTDCWEPCYHPKAYDLVTENMIQIIRGQKCKWNGKTGHPCYLFARKFTVFSLASLLKLSYLLGY